jgi:hypothetical protein
VYFVAREELVLIKPAPYAPALERIMQATGESFVLVAVTDEAGIELDGLF